MAQKHFGKLQFATNKVAPELENLLADFEKKQNESGAVPLPMLSLEELSESSELVSYSGIYIPGGHAPKQDLVHSAALGKILGHFQEKKKPTAIICHAPITFLATMPGWDYNREITTDMKSTFPYLGYQITLGSLKEEWMLENVLYLRGHKLKYYVEQEAIEVGLKVNTLRIPATKQFVVDRELLTGGNPASTSELADRFLEALKKQF